MVGNSLVRLPLLLAPVLGHLLTRSLVVGVYTLEGVVADCGIRNDPSQVATDGCVQSSPERSCRPACVALVALAAVLDAVPRERVLSNCPRKGKHQRKIRQEEGTHPEYVA